jgi:hypothetical protein
MDDNERYPLTKIDGSWMRDFFFQQMGTPFWRCQPALYMQIRNAVFYYRLCTFWCTRYDG